MRKLLAGLLLVSSLYAQEIVKFDYDFDGKIDYVCSRHKEGKIETIISMRDSDFDGVYDTFQKKEEYGNGSNVFIALDSDNDGNIDRYTRTLREWNGFDLEQNNTFRLREIFDMSKGKLKRVRFEKYDSEGYLTKTYVAGPNGSLEFMLDIDDSVELSVLEKLNEKSKRQPTQEEQNEFQEYLKTIEKLRKDKDDIKERLGGLK